MVLDATFSNTKHYKVWIKGKMEQSRERINPNLPQLCVVAIEKGAFRLPSIKGAIFTFYLSLT